MEKKNKMKKIFKNLFIFSLICVFSSCEFFTDSFNAPVKDFFMDNTEAAAIELFEFSSETYKNPITEKLTVSSLQDINVVLYLRNPQEYNFITSENMTSTFGSFLKSEYYLVQDENDKNIINLTIPKDLLEKTEIESRNNEYNKSLSFLINLFHPVSKAEFLPFTLEFDCDTIPPKILSPVFYNTNSSYIDTSKQNNYVIAFNMPKKSEVCSLGIHNDLEKILIDETKYEVSIADDGTISFPNNPEIIAGDVNTIEGIEPINIKFVTQDDYQPFYFVTNKQTTTDDVQITMTLQDKAGFSSTATISSNTKIISNVTISSDQTIFTAEGTINLSHMSGTEGSLIKIIPPTTAVNIKGETEEISGVTVQYSLKNKENLQEIKSEVIEKETTLLLGPGNYTLECVAKKETYFDSITTFNIKVTVKNIEGGGTIEIPQFEDVKFSASQNNKTITIDAKINSMDITSEISEWEIKIYSGFTDVTENFTKIGNNKFSLPDNFPDDEVLQIFVSGKYNGFDYGQTLTLTLKKDTI